MGLEGIGGVIDEDINKRINDVTKHLIYLFSGGFISTLHSATGAMIGRQLHYLVACRVRTPSSSGR